jgi:mRNA-degrading endonuclease RelE of RelBE toxin-antitoxin system
MQIKWSPVFEKNLLKYDAKFREKVKRKLKLFLDNKNHPSLRYKKVQALNASKRNFHRYGDPHHASGI